MALEALRRPLLAALLVAAGCVPTEFTFVGEGGGASGPGGAGAGGQGAGGAGAAGGGEGGFGAADTLSLRFLDQKKGVTERCV